MKPELNLSEGMWSDAAPEKSPGAFLPETLTSAHQGTATVLAQQFDQDVIGDLGNALNTFIESGQIWALIIGFVLGYLLRGVTTYK